MLDDMRKSKLLNENSGVFDEAKDVEEPPKKAPTIFTVIFKLNVNDFESGHVFVALNIKFTVLAQLINPNGAEIAFGIELVTLTADNVLFLVRVMWCTI